MSLTALAGVVLVAVLLLAAPAAIGDTLGRARFSWEAVADPVVTGYKVHWGSESGVYTHSLDAGNVVEVIITGFAEGGRYFAAITAYDKAGAESDYSTELFFIFPTAALPSSGDFVAIIEQPQDARVAVGGAVRFSATVIATGPVSYQWFHAGVPVPNECRTSITLVNVQQDQGGLYTLSASTDKTTVSTRSATLSVLPPDTKESFQIRTLSFPAAGQVTLEFEGALGTEIGVYVSSDLVNWSLLATFANSRKSVTFNDPEAINAKTRFYRLGDHGRRYLGQLLGSTPRPN